MKIDRRNFLSLVIGGAAGTALSPLPWKLTDDLSIWTQNWPWTPIPQNGAVNYKNSACSLCPGGCGIAVRKVDDRPIKIEGLKGHPVNDGGLCILGLSGLQLLYSPARVQTPLKKVGKRGNGKWKKISWDEAISEIAKKLNELRSEGQPHTVACISGSAHGTVARLFERFLTAYGSPNFFTFPSIQDSYEITFRLMHGRKALPGFDFENANFILSFGSGLIDGWGSPVRMFRANSGWRTNSGQVVQIEPRLSNTAAKADQWIAINPGTEATLAMGLACVIIQESLYHNDFIENYTAGFDNWKQLVQNGYSPDQVARITGVKESVILSLARTFAGASKPLAVCGRGQGNTPGSLNEFIAVHALNALVGNINKEGGVWAVPQPDYIGWSEVQLDTIAANGLQQGRIDGAGSKKYPYAGCLLNKLPGIINSGKESPIQALFVTGANPLYSLANTGAVKKAFGKIPFVVSFSSFLDETAQNADLILPNHTYLERYEDLPTAAGLQQPVISLCRPVVDPVFNTKHVGDTVILIAQALGGHINDALAWDSYKDCLEQTLGDKWKTLQKKGTWADPDFAVPNWGEAFHTSSGKFEFTNTESEPIVRLGPVQLEGNDKSYPLILIPYDSIRLANGFIGDPPFVIKTVEDTVLKGQDVLVEVNPQTAKMYGLAEGQYAVLSTPKGSAKVKAHLFDGIMPGLVALPRGLGHTAYDQYLADKGINFNALIGPLEDPASGLEAAWGIRANLKKA